MFLVFTVSILLAGRVFSILPTYVHLHTPEEINETNYVILDKPNICNKTRSTEDDLIIAIKTAAHDHIQRNYIRQAWLTEVRKLNIAYVFILGSVTNDTLLRKLLREDSRYNGLVIGKPVDNYYNLTLKTIFTVAWVKAHCPSRWLIYVDDDVFLNGNNTIEFIQSMKNVTDRAIYCCREWNGPIIRDPNSPLYMPESVFKPNFYPDYCTGSGYLIPPNILHSLHEAAISNLTQPKLWIEHLFMTGLIAQHLSIKIVYLKLMCRESSQIWLYNRSIIVQNMGKRKEFLRNWGKIIGRNVSYKRPHYQLNRLTINHSSIDMAGHILLAKYNSGTAEIKLKIQYFDIDILNRYRPATAPLLLVSMSTWILYYFVFNRNLIHMCIISILWICKNFCITVVIRRIHAMSHH